jgi:hypothetical protein
MKQKPITSKHYPCKKLFVIKKLPIGRTRLTLSFVLLFPILLFSQSLKTYNGPFTATIDEEGKATYTYYDDAQTQERIKEGAFKYTGSLADNMQGTFIRSVTGSFKKGLKNGLWTYTLTYKDFERSFMRNDAAFHYNASGSITLMANYKDGLPNGQWSYVASLKQRDKYRYKNTITYSPYKELDNSIITVNFKNGTFSGPAVIKVKGFSATGQFSSDGSMEGKWLCSSPDQEDQIEYVQGGVTKILKRQMPSGKVLENYVEPSASKLIREKVSTGKYNTDSATLNDFELLEGNTLGTDFGFMIDLFSSDNDFLHSKIGGDLSLSIDSYANITDKKEGGYFFLLKPINYVDLSLDPDYLKGENLSQQGDYDHAAAYYKDVARKQLRPNDKETVSKKIKYCDSSYAAKMKKVRFNNLYDGASFYAEVKANAQNEFRKDSGYWLFPKRVPTAEGKETIIQAVDEFIKGNIEARRDLMVKFADLNIDAYKAIVASLDVNEPDSITILKFGDFFDYSSRYNSFKVALWNFTVSEPSLFDNLKQPKTYRYVISEINYRNPYIQGLSQKYFSCRQHIVSGMLNATSPEQCQEGLESLTKLLSWLNAETSKAIINDSLAVPSPCEIPDAKK